MLTVKREKKIVTLKLLSDSVILLFIQCIQNARKRIRDEPLEKKVFEC